MKKVKFGKPLVRESDIDGVQIKYPYKIIDSDAGEFIVTITGDALFIGGRWYKTSLGVNRKDYKVYYANLFPILFKYVKKEIVEIYNTNSLCKENRIGFSSQSSPIDERVSEYDMYIEGHEIILEDKNTE